MLSEAQQKRVWEAMLAAEIRANYFAELSTGYVQKQKIAVFTTLFFSSSAVVSLLFVKSDYWLVPWLRAGLGVVSAALAAYTFSTQNQKLATETADLHARWNKLARDYEGLWEDVSQENAPMILKYLDERAADASKPAVAIPYIEDRMLHWEKHVLAHRGLPLPA